MMMARSALFWRQKGLFSTPLNSVLTIILLPLCVWLIGSLMYWAVGVAHWEVISENIRILLVGIFPVAELWRAWAAAAIFTFLVGLTLGLILQQPGRWHYGCGFVATLACVAAWGVTSANSSLWVLLSIGALFLGWFLSSNSRMVRRITGLTWIIGIGGVWALLMPAGLDRWSGLMLSIIITVLAAILSFPLGVLLAFGRSSHLPIVRFLCVGYIELIRSLPLISVLYWAWIMMPLILPGDLRIVDLVRGIAGFTIFYAAYVAEYVRGGLQNVPESQSEAGKSLGLKQFHISYYIVLPQAIRAAIPGLVGNILDIFNNVPLVFIIGLMDFLQAGQTILSNPQYIGSEYEIYVFLFGVYVFLSGVLTYASRKLEWRLGVGTR